MSDWQPIETAPKDGTLLLLWLRAPYSEIDILRWEDRVSGWVSGRWEIRDDEFCGASVPTHWQPLPHPPEEPQ